MSRVMDVSLVPMQWILLGALAVVGLWAIVRKSPLKRRAAISGGPGGLEVTAMALLLAGGFFFLLGWLVGCVLLWISPRWRWPDKLVGTLVWPGGLVPAWFLGSVTPSLLSQPCITSRGVPAYCFHIGPSPWVVISALVLLLLGPLAVTVRLWRRARRLRGRNIVSGALPEA